MNKQGKWKITKFWGYNAEDKRDWKYEVAYWTKNNVEDEEYFDDIKEAELYLEECIEEQIKEMEVE
tara:strand:+ start:182 stop:379 length:198 start_codon:yes stop_codon:yes gene_type:complete